jgi:hypothetical protein
MDASNFPASPVALADVILGEARVIPWSDPGAKSRFTSEVSRAYPQLYYLCALDAKKSFCEEVARLVTDGILPNIADNPRPARVSFRLLLDVSAGREAAPFGVAYQDSQGPFLFVPQWRGQRRLPVTDLHDLRPEHCPEPAFALRWADGVEEWQGPEEQFRPLDVMRKAGGGVGSGILAADRLAADAASALCRLAGLWPADDSAAGLRQLVRPRAPRVALAEYLNRNWKEPSGRP